MRTNLKGKSLLLAPTCYFSLVLFVSLVVNFFIFFLHL